MLRLNVFKELFYMYFKQLGLAIICTDTVNSVLVPRDFIYLINL